MKRLTKEQVKREIARRNRLFQNANDAERRVLIAKDVIKQIKAKKIKAESGEFVKFKSSKYNDLIFGNQERSLQSLTLSNEIGQCRCCALGSLMVSCTLFNNKETVSDLHDFVNLGEQIDKKRKFPNEFDKIFSREQLFMMENAFEAGTGYFDDKRFTGKRKSIEFGKRFLTNESRLIGIMENVIENGGTFKP